MSEAYNQRFDGKVIVITGATGGMGKALALRIAREGGSLVLSDLSQDSLSALATEISKVGHTPQLLAADAGDPEFGKELVEFALRHFGKIDGFVPCAGIIFCKSVLEIDLAQWKRVMSVNLNGVFFSLQAVSKAMIEAGNGGAIVTISSTSSRGARPNNADYGITKAGIDHLTRTMALELAPKGIRVNAVSPGVIDTAMWKKVDQERGTLLGLPPGGLTNQMADEIPLGRTGTPEEVADLITFLLSDQAAYITGQIITIDGGFELNHA
ncbi:MAG: SDR family oxidoreductase [Chthoniobacterales bacterium]